MKNPLIVVLIAAVITINIVEITTATMATKLYDADCLSHLDNDTESNGIENKDTESERAFFVSIFLPSMIAVMASTMLAIYVYVVVEKIDHSCSKNITEENEGLIIDVCLLCICIFLSFYYFPFISLGDYKECTDHYDVVVAMVITPVLSFTITILTYLCYIYLIIPCYAYCSKGIQECKKDIREFKEAKDIIIIKMKDAELTDLEEVKLDA